MATYRAFVFSARSIRSDRERSSITHGRIRSRPNSIPRAMSVSIKVDSAGRVVLPAEVRRQLQLTPGSTLRVDVVADRIELTPQTPAPELVRRGKRLVIGASGEPYDAAAAVRAERDALARRGTRR
jgi:AbrB family looped-hinge helix DNA binding protein